MINRVVATVVMAAVLAANGASADETRLTIPLSWEHLPRPSKTYAGATVEAAQAARVPNAKIMFTRWSDGDRWYEIVYGDNIVCMTVAPKSATVYLRCGTASNYYQFAKAEGKTPRLEWVTDERAPPGELAPSPRTEVSM